MLRLYSRPDYTKEIQAASSGGVDVILEMLSNVNLAKDLELLRFRGRVVVSSACPPTLSQDRCPIGMMSERSSQRISRRIRPGVVLPPGNQFISIMYSSQRNVWASLFA